MALPVMVCVCVCVCWGEGDSEHTQSPLDWKVFTNLQFINIIVFQIVISHH